MRCFTAFLGLTALATSAAAFQEAEHYRIDLYEGQLTGILDPRIVGLQLRSGANLERLAEALEEMNFSLQVELEASPRQIDDRYLFLVPGVLAAQWRGESGVRSPELIRGLNGLPDVQDVGRLFLPSRSDQTRYVVFDPEALDFEAGQWVVWFNAGVTSDAIDEIREKCSVPEHDEDQISPFFENKFLWTPQRPDAGTCLDDSSLVALREQQLVPLSVRASRPLVAFADAFGQLDTQWQLGSDEGVNAFEAWKFLEEKGVSSFPQIAVFDQGFDVQIQPLAGTLTRDPGRNFLHGNDNLKDCGDTSGGSCPDDSLWHGHAAAVLAGGEPVFLGSSPRSSLILIVEGRGSWQISESIGYARQRLMSQGGFGVISSTLAKPGADLLLSEVKALREVCDAQGRISCFFSAGNFSNSVWPARLREVVAVGALMAGGQRWPYSNNGEVWAPSGPMAYEESECPQVGSTDDDKALCTAGPSGAPAPFGGTSGAAPIAAGVAALVQAACPDSTFAQVRKILADSSSGMKLNALAAVQRASAECKNR